MFNNSQDPKAGGTRRSDSGRLAPKFTLDATCHTSHSWRKKEVAQIKCPLAVMNHELAAHSTHLVAYGSCAAVGTLSESLMNT